MKRNLSPFSFASDTFSEMDRFFDDVSYMAPRTWDEEQRMAPVCDVSESDEHFLMSLDLPGMKKEDIKIEVNDHTLTVSGERKRDAERYEKSYGFFKRSFSLPSTVDTEQVEANYEDGVLKLYLPKSEVAKPRQINIGEGKGGMFDKFLGSKKSGVGESKSNKAS